MKTYITPEIKTLELEDDVMLNPSSIYDEVTTNPNLSKPLKSKRFNADYMDDDEAFDSFDEF